MKKEEFLKELEKELSNVKNFKEILYDYSEHIEIGLKEGKSEEEIIHSMGNPTDIAKQYKTNNLIKEARDSYSAGKIMIAVLAFCSLGFFNIVFVLPIFLTILGILFGFWIFSIGTLIAGLAIILATVIIPFFSMAGIILGFGYIFSVFASSLFLGIGILSLGVVFLILMIVLTKFIYDKTLDYLAINLDIITK